MSEKQTKTSLLEQAVKLAGGSWKQKVQAKVKEKKVKDAPKSDRPAAFRKALKSADREHTSKEEKKAFFGGGPSRAKQVEELARQIYEKNPGMDPSDAFAQASRQLAKKASLLEAAKEFVVRERG